ncbi:hypothetical protein RB8247 [Rhodopirellula baltica SH 1]|uniref:Uncharacterized protein n=1 Tax=Rhodopirellula baltica (strain DSM 10527 / NCIMB 13988 / SH1) TaxID=243090 RepID=Q7UFY8_RHOBA|nr:hypothetical protein RB8247 [Rhodopirellula baltica SH 1]
MGTAKGALLIRGATRFTSSVKAEGIAGRDRLIWVGAVTKQTRQRIGMTIASCCSLGDSVSIQILYQE